MKFERSALWRHFTKHAIHIHKRLEQSLKPKHVIKREHIVLFEHAISTVGRARLTPFDMIQAKKRDTLIVCEYGLALKPRKVMAGC